MRRRFLSNINKSISEYFTIEALEDGLTVSLSQNACEYCIDNGNWNNLSADSNTPSINKGQTLSFKGNLTPALNVGIGTFTISKKCNLKGNIMSMLYGDDFVDKRYLTNKDYAFYSMFYNCRNVVEAHRLILPATALADFCYSGMFKYCTSLITTPELPAKYLNIYCYLCMFAYCTSLVSAPELPATELFYSCYLYMFSDCTKLNYIKALFTTTPSTSETRDWVKRVSSTGTFIKNKNATWYVIGVNGIPKGWRVQTA